MPQSVVDHSSNPADNTAHAATVVGRGNGRRAVFDAIYTGKKQIKTAKEIAQTTGMTEIRVLQEGKALSDNHIVTATKVGKYKAYQKIDFFHRRKKKILQLAASKKQLAAFPTKVNPVRNADSTVRVSVQLRIPRLKHKARHLTVDDIDNFAKVQTLGELDNHLISETQFKHGIAAILGERGSFKDWGGESRDLSSTRLKLDGKRRIAAFAFKGPGQKGVLTPGKMGKNGDQIQRLVRCPAEVFVVQYWAQIDDSVIEQLKALVTLKSYLENEVLWWGVIDGNDSARLMAAYPSKFR
jgi:hypothetical protein